MTENPNSAAVFEAGGKFRALPILLGFSPYRLLGGVGQIGRRPAKAPLPRSRDRDSSCWWAVASRHLAFLAAFLVSENRGDAGLVGGRLDPWRRVSPPKMRKYSILSNEIDDEQRNCSIPCPTSGMRKGTIEAVARARS